MMDRHGRYYRDDYQRAMDEHQQHSRQHQRNMQHQHQYNMPQQYQQSASAFSFSNGASMPNYLPNLGNFVATMANLDAAMGSWAAGIECLFPNTENTSTPEENYGSSRRSDFERGEDFIEHSCRSNASDGNGVQFSDSDNHGGRVMTTFPSSSSVQIQNRTVYLDGVPSRISTTIPVFSERIERQDDGRQNLMLELDTSRFDESTVQVLPRVDSLVVHIEHSEELPNGAKVKQTFDIPHKLPKANSDDGGLVTYFVDGILSIEAPMAG